MLSKTWDLNDDSTRNALTNIIGCYILTARIKLGFSSTYLLSSDCSAWVWQYEWGLICMCMRTCACVCRHACLCVQAHVCFPGNRIHNSVHPREALFCRAITPALLIFPFHWGLIKCHGYFEYNPWFFYVSLLSSQDCMPRLSDPASLFMVQGLKHCSASTVLTAELDERWNRNIKVCWKIFEELTSGKSTLVLNIGSLPNISYYTFDRDQHQREDRRQEKSPHALNKFCIRSQPNLQRDFEIFGLELHCQPME